MLANQIFTDHLLFEQTFDENFHQIADLTHGILFRLVVAIELMLVQKTPAFESLSAAISSWMPFLQVFKLFLVVFEMKITVAL